MLFEIMNRINNFFVIESYKGVWTIEDGRIVLPFVQKNQYFRIYGSVFNDGVYKMNDYLTLQDETFEGVISGLAIPNSFLELVSEIEQWQVKYADAVTPYSSESFADYSYSISKNDKGQSVSWYDAFSKRLSTYRKV